MENISVKEQDWRVDGGQLRDFDRHDDEEAGNDWLELYGVHHDCHDDLRSHVWMEEDQ